MAAITVRDLDDSVKERLRRQAAANGRSMEAEARAILEAGVSGEFAGMNIGQAFRKVALELGGLDDIEWPSRDESDRRPVVFSEEWEAEREAYNAKMRAERTKKGRSAA